MKNIRSRSYKFNAPSESPFNPSDFVLSADDLHSNDKDIDPRWITKHRHNYLQISFLVLTALVYLLNTLRAYIPASLQTTSHFWSSVSTRPITRVYTSDLRPSAIIESLVLRLAENWQAFWLFYVLSYIPRRTPLGYVYRHPDVFNSCLCFLLICALAIQSSCQLPLSPEVACACLCLSAVLLVFICRLVAVKLVQYEQKYQAIGLSLELIIIRYFILNSLFLYTTAMIYSTVCACIECLGLHWDPSVTQSTSMHQYTTLGLSITLVSLLVYFLFDRCVYEKEFRSIWTPYLFVGYIFICPPLRQLSLLETNGVSDPTDFYLLWIIFGVCLSMFIVRLYRQLSMKCGERRKKKIRISSHIEQITSGTNVH